MNIKKWLILPLLFFLTLFFSACIAPNQKQDLPISNQDLILDSAPVELPTQTDNSTSSTTKENMNSNQASDQELIPAEAELTTSKGKIVLKLYPAEAPNTVKNFVTKEQDKFYENLIFHRVEDWVIQGGDPEGNGMGGGQMPTELNQMPFKTGSLGVARGGNIEISNDAQFFICKTDCNFLTGQYTNFGEVISGMDVVEAIEIGDTIEGLKITK